MSRSSSHSIEISIKETMAHWVFSPLAGATYEDWANVLKQYGEHIPPRYWPRVMFTTAMSLMNSAISVHEQKKYRSRVKSIRVEAPIFIIGHHRSGTTHLWRLLARDDRFIFPRVMDTIFPKTLLTFGPVAHKLAKWFSPQERPQDDMKQPADSPLGEEWGLCTSTLLSTQLSRYFPQYRERFKYMLSLKNASPKERKDWKDAFNLFAQKLLFIQDREDATILFKSQTNMAKIELLLEAFPDARFIHIYRDPYRVFQSTMRMEKNSLPFCAYQAMNIDKLERYVLWRHREMHDAFFADRSLIPDNHFTQLSYKDLVQDRVGAIRNIYENLNLGGFAKMKPELMDYIDSISDYQTNSYPPLPYHKKEQIATSWKPFFDEFGYSTELEASLAVSE